jgi:hypothetical protein
MNTAKALRLALVAALGLTGEAIVGAVHLPEAAAPRVRHGALRLEAALVAAGAHAPVVRLGRFDDPSIRNLLPAHLREKPAAEGFVLASAGAGQVVVAGADDSGILYGSLELARRLGAPGGLGAAALAVRDAPVFRLRGPCVGMQKTRILPGRRVYEYPYTPDLFPFFYDRAQWTEYLDVLAELRMNTLTLWNGCPFGSLVRVPGHEDALEVAPEVFARNVDTFKWLAAECDRRGIWLVQQFYSILLPEPLARRHGLPTQLAELHPVAMDYTRKAIAAFVESYPNVGLMPCLGEALQAQDLQTRWCTEVILAGVKDGIAATGLREQPPVILRTHATDATIVVPEALKVYGNLYTEAKFNGESLTTWEPRGVRQELHLAMSRLGSTHVANVHILANLEPFRYGAVRFISRSVRAMRDRLGARGLHLYPLFYWDWPDSPDIAPQPLRQWERDWIWFEAWARYAWDPDRVEDAETEYWLTRIGDRFGAEAAPGILRAYNDAGECAPRLLRRFGITEGNRQTFSLGMTLDQLVRPERYREFPELWESQAPPGERLKEFADKEARSLAHTGETPLRVIADARAFSASAVAAIEEAAPRVERRREEFERLRNDVHAIRALSLHYAAKAEAALAVLRYGHGRDLRQMERAETLLAESCAHFAELTRLAEPAYRAANSMQTSQRRIPVPGGVGVEAANYRWSHLLPVYERELADFRARVAALRSPNTHGTRTHAPLPAAPFRLLTPGLETFTVQVGNTVFSDSRAAFVTVAPELEGLQGIKVPLAVAIAGRLPPIEFETSGAVRVLVGYFAGPAPEWRRPPTLETDAGAGERGGLEPLLTDAATFDALPPLTVHAFDYGPGRHTLALRGEGAFIVLGFVR